MKAYARSLAVAAVLAAPTLSAHGDPMAAGQLSISGASRATATGVSFTGFGLTSTAGASGTFENLFSNSSGIDLVSLKSFSYSAVNKSSQGTKIVKVFSTGSAGNLVLDLTNVTEATCKGGDLCVSGTGYLKEADYDETPATFELQEGNKDNKFSAMISASPAPEPSSLLLLGTGLLGTAAALYRRKRFTNPS